MRYILTAQPDAVPLALAEAGRPRVLKTLAPGVVLCEEICAPDAPMYLRHVCPAEVEIPLAGERSDLQALSQAFSDLCGRLSAAQSFSVQTRILEGFQPDYKRFDVNTALADLALASGAALDVKSPAQIVSVTLSQGRGFLGLSTPEENISDWAGGARRYKREAGQVSRAEFKLLEALEVFGLTLLDGQRALDLGAAPGGWTRILRRHGLYVVAVDPAALDPRIGRDRRVTHIRKTAQAYFEDADASFDLMVNDMKMDSAESAALTAQGAASLRCGGCAILTLKLPEDASTWSGRVEQATQTLRDAYEIIGVRQLFHNRSEVTFALRKK